MAVRNTTYLRDYGLLGLIGAALVMLLWQAPVEASLGSGIKIVYLHVALIWTGMLGFTVAGLVGLALTVTGWLRLFRWMQIIGWVTLAFFSLGVVVSLLAEQVNWGAILWQEPRNTAVFNVTAVALIVLILNSWLPWRRFTGLLTIALAAFTLYTLPGAPRVFHPEDPIGSSSAGGIQNAFYGAFILCLLAAAWSVWLVGKSQRSAA